MSLSIDTSGIFTYANTVVTMMMPIVVISAGFSLGFGLVNKIGGMFNRAL
jgi:hypothetical protein